MKTNQNSQNEFESLIGWQEREAGRPNADLLISDEQSSNCKLLHTQQ